MAKNWMAYEAAEVLLKGTNKEEVSEVGSRYPLFTVAIMRAGTDAIFDILKAVPKVTARVIETGLKDIEDSEPKEEKKVVSDEPKKAPKKEAKGSGKVKEEDEDEEDYENMTNKDLYKLCCERGLSAKCKDRKKETLIAVLKGEEISESDEDDWDDEEEEETDPYAGKTAKELFKMCTDRGIKTKPKQSADAYVKLLKKADEAETEADEDEDDDDDDWEI